MTDDYLLHETNPVLSPAPALDRIAVLLRHIDDQLAVVKHDFSPIRRLSVADGAPDLEKVVGPLEEALALAADRLGIEPRAFDARRALLGALHIIWADLIDMSPHNLRKHWAVHDVPEPWAELHSQLLAAVETAIAKAGRLDPPGHKKLSR